MEETMVNLNSGWQLHESRLDVDKNQWASVLAQKEGWYDCSLPADVRMPLLENGVIKEPLKADYCFESEWIEKRAWWFKKEFDSAEVDFDDDIIQLILEGLDSRADIFVNGNYIGTHVSVHYPFVYDIKGLLVEGTNTILVRVTTGLEEVTDKDLAELNYAVCTEYDNGGKYRSDKRRAFVRRPQYTVGWDWGPKVVSCGITGGARLEGHRQIALREVYVQTVEAAETAKLKIMLNIENLGFISSRTGAYKIRISYEGKTVYERSCSDVLLTSGYNYIEEEAVIENAQLWWPNGYGSQPLYDVEVEASCNGATEHWHKMRYGIRTISIDTSVISGEDRKFEFLVNGKKVFCKGGNWIPNDFIYARVTDEKYRVLIDEAIEANFNMLRIWGGGLYERDLFYELCDEKGIMLWHDFMFACATLPDHRQQFREEIRREFDYQTKRLRNHCSLAVFCGSNEVHWLFNHLDNPRWGIEFSYEHAYGMSLMNILAKEIIHANCPSVAYWNSSPYGGERPNDNSLGDIHHWNCAFMSHKMEERIEVKDYDKIGAKFVSEYGYVGPCCQETIEEYMDGQPLDRSSKLWWWHSNVFEKGTVHTAIEKNYVDHAEELSLDDYITYGGLVHGLMYGYSLESMKFKEHCYGGLIWMYNDAWGEVGWTIIDYYLRRKIPFYAVKRSLAHRKFAMRVVDGDVVLQGINDLPEAMEVTGRFGWISFDGKEQELRDVSFRVEAGERNYLLREKLPQKDFTKGTMVLYVDSPEIANAWLRMDDMRKLAVPEADVTCLEDRREGDDRIIRVTCNTFAHAVHVDGNWKCSDNYFDLLPGEEKTFTVKDARENALTVSAVNWQSM